MGEAPPGRLQLQLPLQRGVARQPGQVHKDSDPLKPLDIHHEDGGAAHHDLHGHGGVVAVAHLGGGGDHLLAAVGVLPDDVDDGLHLLLVHADEDGHVARHQKAAGGGQLGGGEALLGQGLGDGVGVIVIDNRKNQFHCFSLLKERRSFAHSMRHTQVRKQPQRLPVYYNLFVSNKR